MFSSLSQTNPTTWDRKKLIPSQFVSLVGLIKSRNEFDFLLLKLRTVTEFLDLWKLTKRP